MDMTDIVDTTQLYTEKASFVVGLVTFGTTLYDMFKKTLEWFEIIEPRETNTSNSEKDPFIKYYILSLGWFIIFSYLNAKFMSNDIQAIIMILLLTILFVLPIIAVLWRKINLQNFIRNPSKIKKPLGLGISSSLVPYFLVLPLAAIIIFLHIIVFIKNYQYLLIIYFFITLILLGFIRLWWEKVDSDALLDIQNKNIDLNIPHT